MRFKVHYDLKDYSTALTMLAQSDEDDHFEEALQLIKKQRLFKLALDAYASNKDRLMKVKRAFGQYLDDRGFFDEAGSIFLAAAALEQAQGSFLKALNVQMSLAVLTQRGLGE